MVGRGLSQLLVFQTLDVLAFCVCDCEWGRLAAAVVTKFSGLIKGLA
jgi:hypothetical protein